MGAWPFAGGATAHLSPQGDPRGEQEGRCRPMNVSLAHGDGAEAGTANLCEVRRLLCFVSWSCMFVCGEVGKVERDDASIAWCTLADR